MKRTTAWVTSSGKALASLEEAQIEELSELLNGHAVDNAATIAQILISKKAVVVDILTTTEHSRPAARKINGASKKRKTVPMPEAKASA